MAKLDIDFILIDESVVMNGFRALMKGSQLTTFIDNPVMLFMHNRAQGSLLAADNDIILPIGKWYDIRVEAGKLLAKPDFDDNDEFAKKIESKVKGGYLNGASIWIDPVACSDDMELALAGQRGPTITEWGVLEASIVDIPNCRSALAIRNSAGQRMQLSAKSAPGDTEVINYLTSLLPKQNIPEMDKKLLCAKIGLPEDATDKQISDKLSAIQKDATAHTQLATENTNLKNKIVELNTAQETAKVEGLVDGAIAAKKLAAGDRERYMKLAKADFDTTKELIESMKPYEAIEDKLSGGDKSDTAEIAELVKLSGKDLYLQGKLERLMKLNLEAFKPKYKEAFGIEYKG